MEWRPDHEEEKAGSAHRDLRAGGPLAAGLCGADFPGAGHPAVDQAAGRRNPPL